MLMLQSKSSASKRDLLEFTLTISKKRFLAQFDMHVKSLPVYY